MIGRVASALVSLAQIDKADGFIARVRLAQEEKQRDRIEGLYLKAVGWRGRCLQETVDPDA